jgi:predicted RNA-binding Zn ribbon-like protein
MVITSEMPNAVGGILCLDLVNTVDPRHAPDRREYLDDYDAVVAWASHVGAIDEPEARRLRVAGDRAPRAARLVVARARRLREALYRIFGGIARGEAPSASDLECLNGELSRAMGNARVISSTWGFSWTWGDAAPGLDCPLWPVVRSAADLLVSGPLDKVRECPGDAGTCGWLFVDHTKNSRRRWCEMRTCGNRAKARRYYARSSSPSPNAPRPRA